jgi:hypothetical protein
MLCHHTSMASRFDMFDEAKAVNNTSYAGSGVC